MFRLTVIGFLVFVLYGSGVMMVHAEEKIKVFDVSKGGFIEIEKVFKIDEEWKKILTPEQFQVTRKKGTERAFTGPYWNTKDKGVYKCIACGNDLFLSETKFDSGTGWPSFWQPVAAENILQAVDRGFFMQRVEILCARCGAHLGHVFDDGCPYGATFLYELGRVEI